MAKYSITHTCGCEETVQLFGKTSERDRKIQWLESKPCRTCENKAASEKATAQNQALALPALTGSEKQIAWAETIRAKTIPALREIESKLRPMLAPGSEGKFSDAARQELNDGLTLLVDEVVNKTDARYWIDHRDESYSARTVLDDILKRGLAPTASAELEAHQAAKALEAAK